MGQGCPYRPERSININFVKLLRNQFCIIVIAIKVIKNLGLCLNAYNRVFCAVFCLSGTLISLSSRRGQYISTFNM